jgi:transposase-like protein
MNLIQIFKKFPTQESCIEYLEQKRWGDNIICPYCESSKTCKHLHRNQCWNCKKSFSVTVGTIFHHTHLPIQKWFLAITLILNAKKGISSRQLARDLELPVKTAWSLSHRIRKAMTGDQAELLSGIVEMDETYIGGKPRKEAKKKDKDDDDKGSPRGRATKKECVVGMIERGGKVKAGNVSKDELKAKDLQELVRNNINTSESILMTDEYRGYFGMNKVVKHFSINHSKEYARGAIHTNSIESFWAIVKRGMVGQFHKVSKKYLNRYLDEFCWRFNNRDNENNFDDLVGNMLFVRG